MSIQAQSNVSRKIEWEPDHEEHLLVNNLRGNNQLKYIYIYNQTKNSLKR